MNQLRKVIFVSFFLSFCEYTSAGKIECINAPTTEVVDYGTGNITVRIYSSGGVVSRFIFAPFNRINIGGSLDVNKFIGYDNPEVREPSLYFKWKVFDGTKHLPSVAVGYDGQGYNFVSNQYILPSKGLYLVFSKNVLFSKMFADIGVNLTKYKDSSKPLCFLSLRAIIEDIVSLDIECENVNEPNIRQVNFNFGLILAKTISIDFIFINVIENQSKIERQLRINYLYKFL